MAVILNIETSSKICSVALSEDGQILFQLEDHEGQNHAVKLAPFVRRCLDELKSHGKKLDAVAVSNGPGSYTGLRIGLSMAKGLCFGLDIPLITLSTLEVLVVKAMFRSWDNQGDEIVIPMIDARRMEVFAGVYDLGLNELAEPGPKILDADSYKDIIALEKKIIFIGDGVDKARDVINAPEAEWVSVMPVARDMMALSEKYFREGKFADPAYSVPGYLKEWQPSVKK